MITKIKNAVFITDKLEKGKNLYIKDDKILSLTDKELPCDRVLDAEGAYVSPGFVDIHTHGGGGYDFADGEVSDILNAAYAHAEHGTTSIFPTSTSISFEDILQFVKNVKTAMDKNAPGKPNICGAHLEGPYFSYDMRGAQDPRFIKSPVPEEYEKWVKEGCGSVRRISYAPELEGSMRLLKYLNEKGIVSAYAHTTAVYEEIKPLVDLGCKLATHLYSGMNTVTRKDGLYRKLGAVETAFLEDDIVVEVIADGVHLPPELLKLIYKIKGADKICMVTDSIRGAGQESGIYILGPKKSGMECMVKKGDVAYLCDMSSFAGSVATADRLVRVMYKDVNLPLCDVIKMMCETPCKVMKMENRGKIKENYFADLVFFDEDVNIKKVIIGGEELK